MYECIICIENIKKHEIIFLNCNHFFHNNCIKKWQKINNSCPCCRENISVKKSNIIINIESIVDDIFSLENLHEDNVYSYIIGYFLYFSICLYRINNYIVNSIEFELPE